ncbi:hypothetical protein EMIT0P44_20148 [Pseudomonas sp. IT-P44]
MYIRTRSYSGIATFINDVHQVIITDKFKLYSRVRAKEPRHEAFCQHRNTCPGNADSKQPGYRLTEVTRGLNSQKHLLSSRPHLKQQSFSSLSQSDASGSSCQQWHSHSLLECAYRLANS